MKSFYTLKLPRPREKELFSAGGPAYQQVNLAYRQVNLPSGCPRLHSAQETKLYSLENGILVRQQLSHEPLYLELFWVDTAKPVTINYEIQETATVLFYMLQGRVKIKAAGGVSPGLQTIERFHYLAQNRTGSYTAFYPKGQHLCFFIVVPDSWMVQHSKDFPLLEKLVMSLKNNHLGRHQVPQIYINRDLYRWLDKQRKLQPSNSAILEVFILQFLAHLLHGYESALARQHALALKALESIEEQYTLQDFSHLWLTSQLFISKKTLFQRFKAAFGCTPTAFAIGLRMKHAHKLLTEENLPVKEVYFTVGYSSDSAFRAAYKLYLESLNRGT
jgi:AraC-like DNA-binding protein